MAQPKLDINTTNWPIDAQDDQVAYPGSWYLWGSIDALNGLTKRTLTSPFDVFQSDYDEGFQHGTWNRQYLNKTSM